jgi:hypothetical protein
MGNRRSEERLRAIAIYGGACSRCGFTDERALQFDHIKGGGSSVARNSTYWRRIIVAHGSGVYDLLCANCNWIKKRENGEVVRYDKGLLLEIREEIALAACGHSNWRKCKHCKQWDDPTNLTISPGENNAPYHKMCAAAYERRRRAPRSGLSRPSE